MVSSNIKKIIVGAALFALGVVTSSAVFYFNSKDENEDSITIDLTNSIKDRVNYSIAGKTIEKKMTYSECLLQTNKKSKILVIGWSNVKIVDLKKVLDSLGIERERVDFELMPEKIKNNFNLKKYYTDILIGPMEHSIAGKGDFSSLISKLERDYANGVGPKVTRICDSNSLKISKSSFEKALLKTDYYNIVRKKESC